MKVSLKKQLHFCENLTDIYILFVTFVLSLFCFPDYSSITEYKFKLFLWGTLIFLTILIIGNLEIAIVGKKNDLCNGLFSLKSLAFIALSAFFFCSLLSFILSEHRSEAFWGNGKFDGLLSDLLYLIAFAAALCFGRLKKWHFISISAVVILNFIIVLLQYFGANPFGLYPAGMTYHDGFILYSGEFLGTFGNVDLISAFLSMAIPLFISASLRYDKKSRLIFFISLFPAVFMLILCKVLAGIVGTAAAVIFIAFTIKSKEDFRTLLFCASVSLTAASAALTVLEILPSICLLPILIFCVGLCFIKSFNRRIFLGAFLIISFVGAVFFLFLLTKIQNADSGRLRIWKDALRIFSENPIFGSGPDSFIYEVSFEFERFSEELGFTIRSSIDCAHNIYLNILANGGIISLAAFIFFIFTLIKSGFRSPLFPAILAFLVQGFFSFEVCSVSAFFYLICGLAVCDKTTKNKDVKL